MEKFIKGDIVVLPFPFSDLSTSKKRPALVLANLPGDDIILCQITSQNIKDQFAIDLPDSEVTSGRLNKHSNLRPNRIFTADKSIVLYKLGTISKNKFKEVRDQIVKLLDQ
jgi:mRNA interferase MazF